MRRLMRDHPVVDLAVTIVVVIGCFYLIQLWVVKPYRIPSTSMVPTLEVSDHVFAARFLYHLSDPARGDIVVFHPNGVGKDVFKTNTISSDVYVKRLVGMPGEVIGSAEGHVYVCADGKDPKDAFAPARTPGCRVLEEPYVHGRATGACASVGGDFGPTLIRPGHYYMLGDNRTSSKDSRCWGDIRESQIIGRAFLTYWPLDRLSIY